MKTELFEVNIPFSGFYGTVHEEEINRTISDLTEHYAEETSEDVPQWLIDAIYNETEWHDMMIAYAKEYVSAFLDWLELEREFTIMTSPRFYNFETDRVFAKINRDSLARLWRMVDRETLTEVAKRRFTSRDGFRSHYSPNWKTWGRLSEWDYNQLGTLLLAAAMIKTGGEFSQVDEFYLVEDYYPERLLTKKGERLMNVFDYMIKRAKRPIRTMRQWHMARREENRTFADTPLGKSVS